MRARVDELETVFTTADGTRVIRFYTVHLSWVLLPGLCSVVGLLARSRGVRARAITRECSTPPGWSARISLPAYPWLTWYYTNVRPH